MADTPGEEAELRYAEGPTTEVDLFIAAPPDAVWAVVSDIELPTRQGGELKEVAWLDGATEPAVGAHFRGRNHHEAVGTWETTSTVVECEPGVAFAWAVGDVDAPTATWRFTLTPEGGGTRLRQWARLGPGRSYLSEAIEAMPDKESRILRRRLREHAAAMAANLEAVRSQLEGPAAG